MDLKHRASLWDGKSRPPCPAPSRSLYLHCSCLAFRLAPGNAAQVCVDVSSLSPCRFSAVLTGAGSCQIYPKIATWVQEAWNFFRINSSPYLKQPNTLKKGSLEKNIIVCLGGWCCQRSDSCRHSGRPAAGVGLHQPYPALCVHSRPLKT